MSVEKGFSCLTERVSGGFPSCCLLDLVKTKAEYHRWFSGLDTQEDREDLSAHTSPPLMG